MRPKNYLGIYIIGISLILFIVTYMNYSYNNYLKASKGVLIYEHNKNYSRKISFKNNSIYSMFNASIGPEIEQISFSSATFKNKDGIVNIHLLGDKPYFVHIEKKGINQNIKTFYNGNSEQKRFQLKTFKKDKEPIDIQESLMHQLVYLPYIPSYLGHIDIKKSSGEEYYVSFKDKTITANITTNESGLITSITTRKYSSLYSDYKNEKGVMLPKKLIINGNNYLLKKIKMNIINTHR